MRQEDVLTVCYERVEAVTVSPLPTVVDSKVSTKTFVEADFHAVHRTVTRVLMMAAEHYGEKGITIMATTRILQERELRGIGYGLLKVDVATAAITTARSGY